MSLTINSERDAYEAIKPHIKRQGEQEECFIISLNSILEVKDIHLMSIGSDNATIFPIKNILKQAILDLACGIILIHTHPSGNVKPSIADIEATKQLKNGLEAFSMKLYDHLIIGNDKYYSFAKEETINIH